MESQRIEQNSYKTYDRVCGMFFVLLYVHIMPGRLLGGWVA